MTMATTVEAVVGPGSFPADPAMSKWVYFSLGSDSRPAPCRW